MIWNAWNDMERLRLELDHLFHRYKGTQTVHGEFPAVNVHSGPHGAVLTAELPGIDPDGLEISAENNAVTIKGYRNSRKLGDDERYLVHERSCGEFTRSFFPGFRVDPDKIEASYAEGILEIHLPLAESDQSKKINVSAA